MGRLISLGVAVASILLIWKGGVLNGVLPQQGPPPLDPGPVISKSGDAMQALKSVHLSLNGILVLNGVAGVKVTGSGDLGDITMDQIAVHHFSLTVDPGKYVGQLKADAQSGVTPQDEAVLTNAGIQVEVWIASSDSLMHQMKIDMSTTQFTWTLTYHFSNFVTGGGSSST